MKQIGLGFAYKNGEIADISEVDRGLKCECSCPLCGAKLITNKGKKESFISLFFNNLKVISNMNSRTSFFRWSIDYFIIFIHKFIHSITNGRHSILQIKVSVDIS